MADRLQDFQATLKEQEPGGQVRRALSRSRALGFAGGVIAVVVILAAVLFLFIGISRVDGNSMYPTYKDGDTVWFVKSGNSYSRGTVVSIKMPGGDHYIKRIVAVPGDTVDIRDGRLIVNGKAVDESYANGETMKAPDGLMVYPYKLPKSKYFVLGDNRENSADSRTFGPVSSAQIQGRIVGQQ